jgi:hypothetical protein
VKVGKQYIVEDNYGDQAIVKIDLPNRDIFLTAKERINDFDDGIAILSFTPDQAEKLAKRLRKAAKTCRAYEEDGLV